MADAALLERLRASIAELEADATPHVRREDGDPLPEDGGRQSPRYASRGQDRAGAEASGAGQPKGAKDVAGALKRITSWVNASERSRSSLRERLVREGFAEGVTEDALERACSYGLVDDARYADVLIRSRIAQGKGSAGIERELWQNEIDPSTVDGWPHEYGIDGESELDRALQFLDRKPPRAKDRRGSAYRKLVQKGYPSSVASTAARMWAERNPS
ncbi:MAG TPA: recombinase RecX [Eggerthellaceae bacterium]|nr:recombinase RecX [Eggerthellaceae bacterium]